MADKILGVRLKPCAHTATEWASDTYKNKVLLDGEIGYEKDTGRYKIGDGENVWANLAWSQATPYSHKHSASDITSGTFSVARGGTGKSSLESGKVLVGNGTSAVSLRAIDTTNGGTSGSDSLITSGAVYLGLETLKEDTAEKYISGLSVSGTTITYTKGNGTTGTITTQDTNNKVTQTITTGNASYRVLFSSTADDTTRTEGARKAANLLFNPSTGALTATSFVGKLVGNADTATKATSAGKWTTARNISIADADGSNTGTATSVDGSEAETLKLPATIKATLKGNADTATSATKATQDGSGNTITSTYLKLTGGTLTLSAFYGLTLKRKDTNGAAISYQNSNGALGGIGFLSGGDFVVSSGTNTTGNILKATTTAATFPGTVTAPTFIGNLTGNADTASKVKNNLVIKINGGTTEGTNLFTYNGSAAKTVNITPDGINALEKIIGYYGSNTADTAGWYKVCTVSQTGYSDYALNLLFTQGYGRIATGILHVHTRCDNAEAITVKAIKWMYRFGFDAGNVIITTGTNTWSLYVKQTIPRYGRIQVQVLSKSGTSGDTSFSLSDNTTVESAAPSGTAATDGATVNLANVAAKWQTARTLTIGLKGKSVDGSGNVSWSLAEMGAVAKAGDTMTGALTVNSTITAVGNIAATMSNATYTSVKASNSNGSVGVYTTINRGLYDFTNSNWIVCYNVSSKKNILYGDATGNAATATQAYTTFSNTGATYYPVFVTGTSSGNKSLTADTAIVYYTRNGVAATDSAEATEGFAYLALGNSTSSTAANGQTGRIRLYTPGTACVNIYPVSNSTNRNLIIPALAGTRYIAVTATTSAVGGTAKPVYVAANGVLTALSASAGGTTQPVYLNAGTLTGISAVAVAYGGTGATTAAGARTNLDVVCKSGDTMTGDIIVEKSGATTGSVVVKNGSRQGSLHVSAAYNLGIYDTTNSNWIIYSSSAQAININGASISLNAATKVLNGNLTIGSSTQSTCPTVGITVHDIRNATIYPKSFGGKNANFYFNMINNIWHGILHVTGWGGDNYASWELAGNAHNSSNNDLLYRQGIGSTWQAWQTILSSANYTSYTVTKTGSGASGTWGINVTGSSASCTGNAATSSACTGNAASATLLKRKKSIVDLTSLSTSTYYPVVGTMLPHSGLWRVTLAVQLNGGVPSWSTHQYGFTVNLDVLTKAGGWGTTDGRTLLLEQEYRWCDSMPASFDQLSNSSQPCFYLRGGAKYIIYTDYDCSWTIYTASTTISSETVAPASSLPSNVVTYVLNSENYSDKIKTLTSAVTISNTLTVSSIITANKVAASSTIYVNNTSGEAQTGVKYSGGGLYLWGNGSAGTRGIFDTNHGSVIGWTVGSRPSFYGKLMGVRVSSIAASPGENEVEYITISKANAGTLPCSSNANGILTVNTHSGNYYHQLGFSSNGNLYHRNFQGVAPNTTTGWVKIVSSANFSLSGTILTITI